MSTWSDLYRRFRGETRIYTAVVDLTPREWMPWAAEAQATMQKRSMLVKNSASITFPAGTVIQPYSFRWDKIISVFDAQFGYEYGISEEHEFQHLKQVLAPVTNTRMLASIPYGKTTNQYRGICTFYTRQMEIYPQQDQDVVLLVNYTPSLPQFSFDDSYWADWYNPADPSDDTKFLQQFNGDPLSNIPAATPEREFFDYERAIIEYTKMRYLENIPRDRDAQAMAARSQARFDSICQEMVTQRGTLMRHGVADYNLNT